MTFVTCDLCDDNADSVSVVTGHNWFSYGGRNAFGGEVVTVKCFEDNSRVKEHLGTDGKGKVPAITPGALGWSAGDIAYYLETGFTPDFDSAGGHMADVVTNMANLPPEDRDAIAAYLLALE